MISQHVATEVLLVQQVAQLGCDIVLVHQHLDGLSPVVRLQMREAHKHVRHIMLWSWKSKP